MPERLVCRVAHFGILLHHVAYKILSWKKKKDDTLELRQSRVETRSVLRLGAITRVRDVVPERRVELVLRLHDLGEESRLAFLVKRGITAEPAGREGKAGKQGALI